MSIFTELIITIPFILIIFLAIYKLKFFSINNISKKIIIVAFATKIISAFIIFAIYTFYYIDRSTADIFRYYDDAEILFESTKNKEYGNYLKMLTGINDSTNYIKENYYDKMNTWHQSYGTFLKNDNQTLIRLNVFIKLFSFGSYHFHAILFSFLSFIGMIMLYKFFIIFFVGNKKILFYSLFFFPSLVFWSSGLIKETLLIFGLGGFLYQVGMSISKPINYKRILKLIFFLLVLLSVKVYTLLAIIPLLPIFIIVNYNKKYIIPKYLISLTIFITIMWNFHYFFPNYNFLEVFIRKQVDFWNFANDINAGSTINIKFLEPDIISFLTALPYAYINVLFRPFFIDAGNFLMLIASFENIFVVFLFIISALYFKKSFLKNNIFYFSLFFVLLFFAVIGLATPVLGAIVRYKIAGLPFLFVCLYSIIDDERIISKIKSKICIFATSEKIEIS